MDWLRPLVASVAVPRGFQWQEKQQTDKGPSFLFSEKKKEKGATGGAVRTTRRGGHTDSTRKPDNGGSEDFIDFTGISRWLESSRGWRGAVTQRRIKEWSLEGAVLWLSEDLSCHCFEELSLSFLSFNFFFLSGSHSCRHAACFLAAKRNKRDRMKEGKVSRRTTAA